LIIRRNLNLNNKRTSLSFQNQCTVFIWLGFDCMSNLCQLICWQVLYQMIERLFRNFFSFVPFSLGKPTNRPTHPFVERERVRVCECESERKRETEWGILKSLVLLTLQKNVNIFFKQHNFFNSRHKNGI